MRSPTVVPAELEFDLDFRQKLNGSTAARDDNVKYSCGYKLLDDQVRWESEACVKSDPQTDSELDSDTDSETDWESGSDSGSETGLETDWGSDATK